MKNIKVGDKFVSKKRFEILDFNENEIYCVVDVTVSSRTLFGFDIDIPMFVQVAKNRSTFNYTFSLNEKTESYFWNYFYTPAELRKEKLKKINNIHENSLEK